MLTEKRRFFLSWLTALKSRMGSVCFITETDSPRDKQKKLKQDNWTKKSALSTF